MPRFGGNENSLPIFPSSAAVDACRPLPEAIRQGIVTMFKADDWNPIAH
jgi:hypothetical protein